MGTLEAVKTYLEDRIAHIKAVDGAETDREVELQKALDVVNAEIAK